MKISTGHFNLFNVFDFVASNPQMSSGKVGNLKQYTTLINELVSSVPSDQAGWYLWGRFNDIGWWETIYLGKAGNKKTSSLRARLKEEMIDERIAFWAFVFGKEIAAKQHSKLYKGKYDKHNTRSLRKTGTQFIVWLSASPITEKEIKEEETTLIDIYRPTTNAQRIRYPKKSKITEHVIRAIDKEIENIKKA